MPQAKPTPTPTPTQPPAPEVKSKVVPNDFVPHLTHWEGNKDNPIVAQYPFKAYDGLIYVQLFTEDGNFAFLVLPDDPNGAERKEVLAKLEGIPYKTKVRVGEDGKNKEVKPNLEVLKLRNTPESTGQAPSEKV